MADFGFDRTDITSLALKLSTGQALTHQEWVLLLAIFAAAAARTGVTDAADNPLTLPEPTVSGQAATEIGGYTSAEQLKAQLLAAYIPGTYFDGMGLSNKTVGFRERAALIENPGGD